MLKIEPHITKSLPQPPPAKQERILCGAFDFSFIIPGGVSDCVYIIVCLFKVYEYACNFDIGFHFQQQPKPTPRNKQK
jgi:hypothetical protein